MLRNGINVYLYWNLCYLFALASVTDRFWIVEALGVAMAVVDDVTSDDARFAVEAVAAETRATDAYVTTASLVKGTRRIEMTVTQLAAIRFLSFCLSTL